MQCHHQFPRQVTSKKKAQTLIFILMIQICAVLLRQDLVVMGDQYGISALVSQISFCRENDVITKRHKFPYQAIFRHWWHCEMLQVCFSRVAEK